MVEDERQKKVVKSNNIFAESPIRVADIKKDDKVQKIAQQIKGSKDKNIELIKSPSLNDPKRETPALPNKKSTNSNDNYQAKKVEIIKPPLPNKPPVPPSSQIQKVKNEKVIQPKVYDSHKNLNKPSGIIKSGGFSTHVEGEKPEKIISDSRQKIISSKRASNPNIKLDNAREPPKQLFGPMTPSQTPQAQHKS